MFKLNAGVQGLTVENKTLGKKLETGIQQLNLSYDKVQDRLLFRVGLSDNTELALWLTYNFTRQLWLALNREVHLPTAQAFAEDESPAEAVQQFKREVQASEALQKMDFATEYTPRKELRNDGLMLATGMKLSDDVKRLDITCLEGVVVNINLTPELILATCNMLQLCAKEAHWELTTVIPPIVMEISSEIKVLH